MMRWTIIPACLALTLLLLAPGTVAQDADVELTFTAPEQCTDTTFCFEVEEGDVGDIEEGDNVTLTFQNEDNAPHNVYVAEAADADVGGDTEPDVAVANIDDVESGSQGTLTFTAPTAGEDLYFWCDVSGHEQGGMYVEGSEDGAGAPAPGFVALALAGLVAAFIARSE